MTIEHVSPRKRRTDSERELELKAQLADLAVKRRAALKKHMEAAAKLLDIVATTDVDVGPLAVECQGLAVRLRTWA